MVWQFADGHTNRRILHSPWFLIFYRVKEATPAVEIVRIWDARKDPVMFSLS